MPKRTSLSHPLQIDGMACGAGIVGMTLCPGKQGESNFGDPWERDLELDMRADRGLGSDDPRLPHGGARVPDAQRVLAWVTPWNEPDSSGTTFRSRTLRFRTIVSSCFGRTPVTSCEGSSDRERRSSCIAVAALDGLE